MPDFSGAARETYAQISISLRDFAGNSATATIAQANGAANAATVTAVREAVGAISNARVMTTRLSNVDSVINDADPANTVYDEVYGRAADALVMIFQNATGDVQRVSIPAPDLSIFQADGETPDLSNALFIAARDAIQTAMPAGFVFARAYLKGIGTRRRVPLPTAEPGVGENPPALPGE